MSAIAVVFFCTILLFNTVGAAMKLYRANMIKYESPDKSVRIISPINDNAHLEHKGKKISLNMLFNPKYIFNSSFDDKIISVGGYGDPGISLGEILVINTNGNIKKIDLKENYKSLESLSDKYSRFPNYPWLTSINFTHTNIELWACNKILFQINLETFDIKIIENVKPEWAKLKEVTKNAPSFLTDSAKKLSWSSTDIEP